MEIHLTCYKFISELQQISLSIAKLSLRHDEKFAFIMSSSHYHYIISSWEIGQGFRAKAEAKVWISCCTKDGSISHGEIGICIT